MTVRRSHIPGILTWLVLLFFYVPIILLVVNSFNANKQGTHWLGFTLRWYSELFSPKGRNIWLALSNTLIVATISTLISTFIGTCSAFALHKYKSRLQNFHYCLVYTPLVVPEILIGISLLIFFMAVKVQLGLTTIVIAHVTFCTSYVAMAVLSRLQDFDMTILEAARDLGANRWVTTWRTAGIHPLNRRFCHYILRKRTWHHDPAHTDPGHDQAWVASNDQRPFHAAFGSHIRRDTCLSNHT